jgi:hypothetical protein
MLYQFWPRQRRRRKRALTRANAVSTLRLLFPDATRLHVADASKRSK